MAHCCRILMLEVKSGTARQRFGALFEGFTSSVGEGEGLQMEVKLVAKKEEKKRAWWALRPFATWPEKDNSDYYKQPVGEMITEDKKEEEEERPWWKFWVSKDKKKEGEPFWKFWG